MGQQHSSAFLSAGNSRVFSSFFI